MSPDWLSPVIVACVASFLTGQLVNLLFVAPFFGFAIAFFPTAGRIDTLRDLVAHE